ncbi:YaeQ family protein [Undibacterium oligocarboniphilum]|uniref:YaeQ family protein n=1 Tax=Undibacterium oligocarboniphilum TaxID=666702 RepID=A0A850QJ81_9BURK|nr:YaeQ family protein [Undibacterium oligocarboniphilum]MBC3868840.1 YaeQ family protein [Undibacterium oligocarboniphilum]NVO76820.1 YaeQ family protein [Undibacterium oligocarboniphilum]
MALKSIIYKADLNISDMDRGYYADHQLTIARHPSETDERMMIRVLAYAMYASERLEFGKGISDTEEPDVWEKDYTGAIRLWVEAGQPDDRRLLKACGRSEQVLVISYASASDVWWKQMNSRLDRAKNLKVLNVPAAQSQALEKLAQRTMQLQCTIQDGQIWMSAGDMSVQIDPETLKDFG